jgi:hypothetical protein
MLLAARFVSQMRESLIQSLASTRSSLERLHELCKRAWRERIKEASTTRIESERKNRYVI